LLDGFLLACLEVLDLQGGSMRLAASMQMPFLQDTNITRIGIDAAAAAQSVVQLWPDGRRAAVGNARHQAVWVMDLAGGRPGIELSGTREV
jgi:hypothetical protein